ncbi:MULTISPECIES: pyrimidine-nucleoside phosphorylase [Kosmotoga]|uniref:Pyrimidine-nucleoside phosphorylase n=1 Tax=Kosmotoga olearia (strain ATCC BAA-1733 / DSM 21960 / TBF 19.5.1) TaxID=521045 RepID=C5CET3_KOSOT|nr:MULTISPECIES: pyrimidine-nucleoside phosphorylase [Kosmotoga]ACR80263.1 pyrimidine-nucleoside phosphorylase [Kosmotoga olearia TBF 19.5.1]MDI3523453.1 pyrimidine-nucleoside phosphorylase [Kosmotoga sp.]MDK2953004.1 pyrimidine-nucleoside phosphorylase [Kosmotoga sp.]OAA20201.1 thymidine phosphorylase [Kosmotoga sp. DU53]
MRAYDVILKKRNGLPNSHEELKFLIEGYVKGEVPDYQVSAWLMAVYFNHLTPEERFDMTRIMLESGDQISLSEVNGIKVDKHSTGGVGDKVTLVVGPIVAAAGLTMAKLSGRGLGHTGGTIDKLESIPGFRTALKKEEFFKIANEVGLVVAGQTATVAPADKKLYALRDVTATVDEISLIASSIMSKKLAIHSDVIVLDVKVGTGAFMKSIEEATELARAMIDIGKRYGRKIGAVVSDMNQPLGKMVGNALEVKEAVETLKGNGPEDLDRLCRLISARLIELARGVSSEEAEKMVKDVLESGEALEKFRSFVIAQGGDGSVVDSPESVLPAAKGTMEVLSSKDGYISYIDAEQVGISSMILGAGRAKKEDAIDYAVGIEVFKKLGDRVLKGDPIARLYFNDEEKAEKAKELFLEAYKISDAPIEPPSLVHEIF